MFSGEARLKTALRARKNQTKEEDTVKRVWLVVALVALGGLASQTFADVQNIRLSGDIRIRGYFLVNAGGDSSENQVKSSASFISQRTRVSVEADLEDHVLVVVTLKAEGLWDRRMSRTNGLQVRDGVQEGQIRETSQTVLG